MRRVYVKPPGSRARKVRISEMIHFEPTIKVMLTTARASRFRRVYFPYRPYDGARPYCHGLPLATGLGQSRTWAHHNGSRLYYKHQYNTVRPRDPHSCRCVYLCYQDPTSGCSNRFRRQLLPSLRL